MFEPLPSPKPSLQHRHAGKLREHELYKFFHAEDFNKSLVPGKPSSPDTLLTSLAQLITLKFDARRSTISFLDNKTQYNIAEATRTLHLDDTTKYDAVSDQLWLGCSRFDSENSICLHTLEALSLSSNKPAGFEVLNLADDPRFSWLPFVHNYPYIKYYYGAPILSHGIAVGSLCILDDKSRPPLTTDERIFMAVVAQNVMSHMQLVTKEAERNRTTQMNRALALFVDPQSSASTLSESSDHFSKEDVARPPMYRYPTDEEIDTTSSSTKSTNVKSSTHSLTAAVSNNGGSTKTSVPAPSDPSLCTFEFAADLLLKSLDIGGGGSITFFGTSPTNRNEKDENSSVSDDSDGDGDEYAQLMTASLAESSSGYDNISKFSMERRSSNLRYSGHIPADILAYRATSTLDTSMNIPEETKKVKGRNRTISIGIISKLIKRYRRGQYWTFDEEGRLYSDSEHTPIDNGSPKSRRTLRAQSEASLLLQYFPGAYQILFSPFWDSRASRWCVCIVTSSSRYRSFTYGTDFLFLLAFCQCIQIELTRSAVQLEDRQKADFIGSISHELRSPLHGIMASGELLLDTELSAFQQSLVDTVDSCARTLLDTINMVLDYSKINSFERDWKKTKGSRGSAKNALNGVVITGDSRTPVQPALNIYGSVDIAAITEEVIDGVTAGQAFYGSPAVSFTKEYQKLKEENSILSGSDQDIFADIAEDLDVENVEVVLDISPRNWTYVTQPGAFRRIVMNLTGNALKYTKKGYIKIKLDVQDNHHDHDGDESGKSKNSTDVVILSVIDTGIGISEEYLRTRLFTPFSQEDKLASGTGLGLSLVKSIVNLLEGEIEVHSKIHKGTSVVVKIPMVPQNALNDTPGGSSGTTGSASSMINKDTITRVQEIAQTRRIAFFHSKSDPKPIKPLLREALRLHHESIKSYLSKWYEIDMCKDWSQSDAADIILLDEYDFPNLLSLFPNGLEQLREQPASFIVFCSNPTLHKKMKVYISGNIEFVSKPIGPYKLAKALRCCLERASNTLNIELLSVTETLDLDEVDEDPLLTDQATLITPEREINVIEMGSIIGADDSSNARKALTPPAKPESSETENLNGILARQNPDPFAIALGNVERVVSPRPENRPTLRSRKTMSPTSTELRIADSKLVGTTAATSMAGAFATQEEKSSPSKFSSQPSRPPRLLLVDDNAINLRLLQTFMRKREYENVASASDGRDAVQSFEKSLLEGRAHEIIFMDISMPIMNGFEATRKIRALEQEYSREKSAMDTPAPALIIALTGLASGRDQSEAFSSGVDLYMTKPVSFREISRILENWEANGGAASGDRIPHGAVSGIADIRAQTP